MMIIWRLERLVIPWLLSQSASCLNTMTLFQVISLRGYQAHWYSSLSYRLTHEPNLN